MSLDVNDPDDLEFLKDVRKVLNYVYDLELTHFQEYLLDNPDTPKDHIFYITHVLLSYLNELNVKELETVLTESL